MAVGRQLPPPVLVSQVWKLPVADSRSVVVVVGFRVAVPVVRLCPEPGGSRSDGDRENRVGGTPHPGRGVTGYFVPTVIPLRHPKIDPCCRGAAAGAGCRWIPKRSDRFRAWCRCCRQLVAPSVVLMGWLKAATILSPLSIRPSGAAVCDHHA